MRLMERRADRARPGGNRRQGRRQGSGPRMVAPSPAEVVHYLRADNPVGPPRAVGQLQVLNHRAILVAPPDGVQVNAHSPPRS